MIDKNIELRDRAPRPTKPLGGGDDADQDDGPRRPQGRTPANR